MTVDESRSRLKSWGLWGALYKHHERKLRCSNRWCVFFFSLFLFFFGAGVEAMC